MRYNQNLALLDKQEPQGRQCLFKMGLGAACVACHSGQGAVGRCRAASGGAAQAAQLQRIRLRIFRGARMTRQAPLLVHAAPASARGHGTGKQPPRSLAGPG